MGLLNSLVSGAISKKIVDFITDWLVKVRWLKESESARFSADLLKVILATIELESGKPMSGQASVGTTRAIPKTPLLGQGALRRKFTLLGKKKTR